MAFEEKPSVCVMGLGYIGLPTAAVIARSGCHVLGIDVNPHVVDTINRGEIHIEEVDLDGLVQGVVSRKLLRASTVVEPADVFVIAVPTPFDENHAPDISFVLDAAGKIAPVLKSGDTVIVESTSPVGHHRQGQRPDRARTPRSEDTRHRPRKRPIWQSPIARNAFCPVAYWKSWFRTTGRSAASRRVARARR